ncbi:collagen alpha-2(VIII) chain-like isoform X2 [Saccostrea cucullata]|uniref:collagen alpha-2(VIII) chain-like isoform X2 n=1 Tax=Saccostrea cuccullata TaxID=36930 RepID=UPI002ED1BFF9
MIPGYFLLLNFFVLAVTGSLSGDRHSCSNTLSQYENCLKTHDLTMETRIQNLETEMKNIQAGTRQVVAFHASLSTDVKVEKGPLKFDKVLFNRGNGYNDTAGVFTAPVQGVYSFTLTLGPYTPKTAPDLFRVQIMKNREIVRYLYIEWKGSWLKKSENTIVELQVGDEVDVRMYNAPAGFTSIGGTNNHPGSSYYSHFSGFLIG